MKQESGINNGFRVLTDPHTGEAHFYRVLDLDETKDIPITYLPLGSNELGTQPGSIKSKRTGGVKSDEHTL